MSNTIGFIIETLVSVLLLVTICYCMLLNKRLRRLKADEQSLKATISELITATEIAERAIGGLKVTVRDCDKTLGQRILSAEKFAADIERKIHAGELVLNRLSQIAAVALPGQDVANLAPPAPSASAVVKAAQAFADRSRARAGGMAA